MADACPIYAPFFSGMGCTAAIVLSCLGASYGTAKSGIGIISTGIMHPEHTVKNLVPVVMSSVIAIFGLIVSVLITGQHNRGLSLFSALTQLSAGITMGLCGLAAGFSIGIIGDCGVRANSQQPRMYVAMVLILVFAEVLALYGLVIGLVMISKLAGDPGCSP